MTDHQLMSTDLIIELYSFMGFLVFGFFFFFLTYSCWHAMLLLLLSLQICMSGGKVTVTRLLQGYFRSVPDDKVTSCAVFVVVHLFPLFKILICQCCPHGDSKTTQTSPGKANDVFLLLCLSLASFWEVRGCRHGGPCACCSPVCTPRDSCAELSTELSWRETPAKKAVRTKLV